MSSASSKGGLGLASPVGDVLCGGGLVGQRPLPQRCVPSEALQTWYEEGLDDLPLVLFLVFYPLAVAALSHPVFLHFLIFFIFGKIGAL